MTNNEVASSRIVECIPPFCRRKALQAEQGKADMEARIKQLEAEKKDLERQVQELKAKAEAIEKREGTPMPCPCCFRALGVLCCCI